MTKQPSDYAKGKLKYDPKLGLPEDLGEIVSAWQWEGHSHASAEDLARLSRYALRNKLHMPPRWYTSLPVYRGLRLTGKFIEKLFLEEGLKLNQRDYESWSWDKNRAIHFSSDRKKMSTGVILRRRIRVNTLMIDFTYLEALFSVDSLSQDMELLTRQQCRVCPITDVVAIRPPLGEKGTTWIKDTASKHGWNVRSRNDRIPHDNYYVLNHSKKKLFPMGERPKDPTAIRNVYYKIEDRYQGIPKAFESI